MNNEEFEGNTENMPEIETQIVAPEGLGFGSGSISFKARVEDVGEDKVAKAMEIVNGPKILVKVSDDKNGEPVTDDGCGDGRNVNRIFEGSEEKTKSLNRSKVFGGGATMATASLIGLGRSAERPIRNVFSDGIALLRDKRMNFGAHTDTHAHDGNCGCGAIDKAPQIIGNAIKFQDQITSSIRALGVDDTGLDEVFANFRQFAPIMDAESYKGESVMGEIIDNGKIVKELDDDHKEAIVVLNMVEGYTIDQEAVRIATDGDVQVFGVDVWRVKQIADEAFADESDEVKHKAFLSELVYTLATAGTLTDGTLPVVVVNKQPELVAA